MKDSIYVLFLILVAIALGVLFLLAVATLINSEFVFQNILLLVLSVIGVLSCCVVIYVLGKEIVNGLDEDY